MLFLTSSDLRGVKSSLCGACALGAFAMLGKAPSAATSAWRSAASTKRSRTRSQRVGNVKKKEVLAALEREEEQLREEIGQVSSGDEASSDDAEQMALDEEEEEGEGIADGTRDWDMWSIRSLIIYENVREVAAECEKDEKMRQRLHERLGPGGRESCWGKGP